MSYCTTKRHTWLAKDSAGRCCNGYQSILTLTDTRDCSAVAFEESTGVRYGFRWITDSQAHAMTSGDGGSGEGVGT